MPLWLFVDKMDGSDARPDPTSPLSFGTSLLTSRAPALRSSRQRVPARSGPRVRSWQALFGPHAMSDLSPECAPKLTSADRSEFIDSRPDLPDQTEQECCD